MVQDPALPRSLGRAARTAAEPLTWEKIIGDFEAVLADVAH